MTPSTPRRGLPPSRRHRLTAANGAAPQRRPRAALTALALAALMAGCGGDDDAPPDVVPPPATGNVAVTAALGAVANADVTVTCAATGAVLGTGSSAATGLVTVATSGLCAGPVLVTVSGRGDGTSTYFDEALASTVAFPAGASLRALVPAQAASMSVGVTPLTEVAARQALTAAGSLAAVSAAQVNAANAAVVAQVLGAGVTLDILTPPTPWTSATGAGTLGTGDADRYAFYLAGLARMGLGSAAPALAVTDALGADLADGNLGGSPGGAGGFTYTAAGLPAQLGAGLNAMAGFASPALQGALGVAAPPALVFSSFAPASGAVAATVTLSGSGFDPDPFHVQVKFANNLVAEVVSSSATAVVVKVPAGAVSGPIEISNTLRAQTAISGTSFTVTPSGGGGGGGGADTWVSRASPSGFLLNGLAYGAGTFVAAGFGNALLTSANGLSWTAATPPDRNYYEARSVIWTGSQFVMVGDKAFGSAVPALIATSPDGLAWTRRSWSPAIDGETLTDVASGAGKLTVVGLNGSVASSADGGLTWTNESQSAVAGFNGVAASDTTRVAVGRDSGYLGVVLVDSGAGWVKAAGTEGLYPQDVTWTGSQFVAVGGNRAGFGANAAVMTSPDGVTWTARAVPAEAAPVGHALRAVAAVGGVLYATGDTGTTGHVIIRSADGGVTWTQAYLGTTNGNAMLAGIAASADRLVTVGGVKSVTLP